MAENSGIEWTTHTYNPWWGCTKVSAACDHCYAEATSKRFGKDVWGPHADRSRTGPRNVALVHKWNRQAEGLAERPRVFCASMADVFDNHKSILPEWREDLWKLIKETPNLDWLLLTKRPQNILKMLPADWGDGYQNVWLGATVEHQKAADMNIPPLLNVPAKIRFLSCEPLLGDINLRKYFVPSHRHDRDCEYVVQNGPAPCTCMASSGGLHWVIVGGESAPNFRRADSDWFRSLRDQCAEACVPFLFKQWSGQSQKVIKGKGRKLDGVIHNGYPQTTNPHRDGGEK